MVFFLFGVEVVKFFYSLFEIWFIWKDFFYWFFFENLFECFVFFYFCYDGWDGVVEYYFVFWFNVFELGVCNFNFNFFFI